MSWTSWGVVGVKKQVFSDGFVRKFVLFLGVWTILDSIFLAIVVKNVLKELLRAKEPVSSVLFTLRQLIDLFLVVFMLIIDFIPSQVLSIFCLGSDGESGIENKKPRTKNKKHVKYMDLH